MANAVRQFYEFGPYRIDPDHRQLTRETKPVPLQPKAFDILLVLVQNSERVVPKDDLMKAVWPGTFVEESNLAQNISVLRKTLGDTVGENRYVVTVPGRGYRFAEKVQVLDEGGIVTEEEDKLIVESHIRSRLVVEEQRVPVKAFGGKAPKPAMAGLRFLTLRACGDGGLSLHAPGTETDRDRHDRPGGLR
jgi:DNA-binding winged helix-turn-helix (wHTH) protein